MTGAQLRKLYACARAAGMDDDTLHARCLAQTGREHLRELSSREAAELIDSITGVDTSEYRRRRERPMNRASQEQLNKILALARKLGWLKDGSQARLNGFLRARLGVERLDWLTPEKATQATEALKAMVAGGRGERKQR